MSTRYRISFEVVSVANAAGIRDMAKALLRSHGKDVVGSVSVEIVPQMPRHNSRWTRVDGGFVIDASDLLGPLSSRALTFTCPTDDQHTHVISEARMLKNSEGEITEWNVVCRVNPENGILRIFND